MSIFPSKPSSKLNSRDILSVPTSWFLVHQLWDGDSKICISDTFPGNNDAAFGSYTWRPLMQSKRKVLTKTHKAIVGTYLSNLISYYFFLLAPDTSAPLPVLAQARHIPSLVSFSCSSLFWALSSQIAWWHILNCLQFFAQKTPLGGTP